MAKGGAAGTVTFVATTVDFISTVGEGQLCVCFLFTV
jgi:hypothetical protein